MISHQLDQTAAVTDAGVTGTTSEHVSEPGTGVGAGQGGDVDASIASPLRPQPRPLLLTWRRGGRASSWEVCRKVSEFKYLTWKNPKFIHNGSFCIRNMLHLGDIYYTMAHLTLDLRAE